MLKQVQHDIFDKKLITTTCHPEFISGSRRILTNVQDKWMLKQVHHDIFDKN